MKHDPHTEAGLSLIEVCLVVAAIVLVGFVFLAATSRPYTRAPRILCTSNLKQVGLGFRLWANNHADQFPQVSTNAAGSLAFVNSPQVFRHFAAMSNELVTPKVLWCRTDKTRKPATGFDNFANKNLSYFVGLDADANDPRQLLTGDRNITGGAAPNGFLRLIKKADSVGWTKEMHEGAGNIGLADGSVQQVTPGNLNRQVQAQSLDVIRLAIP